MRIIRRGDRPPIIEFPHTYSTAPPGEGMDWDLLRTLIDDEGEPLVADRDVDDGSSGLGSLEAKTAKYPLQPRGVSSTNGATAINGSRQLDLWTEPNGATPEREVVTHPAGRHPAAIVEGVTHP